MASRKAPAKRPDGQSAARGVFLAELAETANVAASARKAGMPASSVYALRIKSPEFRLEWSEALAEGYARLEASLLEAALGKGPDTADPDVLKRDGRAPDQSDGNRLRRRSCQQKKEVPSC